MKYTIIRVLLLVPPLWFGFFLGFKLLNALQLPYHLSLTVVILLPHMLSLAECLICLFTHNRRGRIMPLLVLGSGFLVFALMLGLCFLEIILSWNATASSKEDGIIRFFSSLNSVLISITLLCAIAEYRQKHSDIAISGVPLLILLVLFSPSMVSALATVGYFVLLAALAVKPVRDMFAAGDEAADSP